MPAWFFNDLPDIYDSLIDWPKRLSHEEPFFRGLFQRVGARQVIDVACGTGRHAAMFHAWGLRVEGADLSPEMIARARAAFGEPAGLNWVVRGFEQPSAPAAPFDVALCVGNSLALAPDMAVAERAVQQMFQAVRAGGLVVLHVLNLWSLPDGPCRWQKCRRLTLADGEVVVAKGVHRGGSRGYVDLVVVPVDAPDQMHSESIPLLGIEAADLERMARSSWAGKVEFFGGYQGQPYRRGGATDLILVAERAEKGTG